MREIKFRAWDKIKNKMFYPKLFDQRMVIQLSGIIGLFNLNKMYDDVTSRFELMQYTGLKDKNGRGIYEGDWLKTFDGEIGEVRYELTFCVYGIQNKKHFRSFENIFNVWSNEERIGTLQPLIEVIGNIYEIKA